MARERHHERRSSAQLALEDNVSLHRLAEPPRDPKPQPQTARAVLVHAAFESLEDARSVFGRDADPLIAHAEDRAAGVFGHDHADRTAGAVTNGVREEIPEDLFEPDTIPSTDDGLR